MQRVLSKFMTATEHWLLLEDGRSEEIISNLSLQLDSDVITALPVICFNINSDFVYIKCFTCTLDRRSPSIERSLQSKLFAWWTANNK